MGWIARLLLDLLFLAGAIGQIREDRRRGIRTDWRKTLATGAGTIAVVLVAVGALAGAQAFDKPVLGFLLFALLLGAGLTLLVVLVNRRWPAVGGAPRVPLDRKGAVRLCAFLGVIAVAFGCLTVLANRGYETAGEVTFFVMVLGGGALIKGSGA